MAKKIKSQDIFQGDVFEQQRKSAQEFIKTLDTLQAELKEVLKVNKAIIDQSKNESRTTESLKKRAEATKQVKNASVGLEKVEQERQRTLQALERTEQQRERTAQTKMRTAKQIRMEEERQARARAKEIKQLKVQNSAYQKQSKRLTELRSRYKDLAVQNKANTTEGKKLLKQIQQLDTKLKQVDATVGQSQRNVGNYGSAWSKLSGKIGTALSAFGLVGGAMGVVSVFKNSLNVIRDFDSAVANLGAISGKTADEIQPLVDQAKQLGESTKFTATEVAGLQVELAKLGFTTEQIQDSTEAILQLSSATGTDLADASFIAGSTLRAFNLDATEMNRVASVLGVATTKSALNMEFLGTAMSKVAPVSSAMGFSIEDTTALLGTLANAGFDASSSATATRNILLKLADANGDLAQTLGEPIKSLDDLAPALAKLDAELGEDGLAKALELTDKRSVSAFKTFMNQSDTLINLRESITDVNDELAQMSEKQLNTIDGQLALLNSKWQGMILGASESSGAVEKIKNAIKFLTENLETILTVIFNVVKALIIFKTTQFAVTTGMKIARGVMIAYRISMVAFSRGVGSATKMLKIFNTAVKSNPIGLLISGLTTAIALLWDFGDDGEEQINKVDEAVNRLKTSFSEMKDEQVKFKEALKLSSEAQVAEMKKELAQMKVNGATAQEIAKKQFEIEQQGLKDHLQVKADVFGDYQKISKMAIQSQKDLDARRKFLVQDIKGVIDLETKEVTNFTDMNDNQLSFFDSKFKMLLAETEEYRKQRKELDDQLQKLTRQEEIIRTNLETKKIETKVEGEKAKTVAFYKALIQDEQKILNTQVTTRKEAIPIQKKIKEFEREIEKILGSQGKGRSLINKKLKQQIDFEKELLELQRKRRNLMAEQTQETLDFQIANVNEMIDDEIKLREEQAKSKEFVAEGVRVSTEQIKNLLDTRFELQKTALDKELELEQEKLRDANRDYVRSIDTRVKEEKLTREQGDALIEANRKKHIEALKLLDLEYKHDVSALNDERVDDFEETDKEILDLQGATIEQLGKDDEDVIKQEKDVLSRRLSAYREFTQQIITLIDQATDRKIQAIDEELSASEKREEELRQLALQGTTTAQQSLAEEQKRQAELERQKAELEKRKLRRQAIVSGLELLSNKLDNDEPDAVSSTIRDITSLIGILSTLPAFKEGTEFVDGNGAPKGRDKIIARIDEGERIMTREQNQKIGDLSNEELTTIAQSYKNGMFEDTNYLKPKIKSLNAPYQSNAQILSKFDELKSAIENKPMLTEVRWDEITKMIVEKVETKNRIYKNHSSSKGIF